MRKCQYFGHVVRRAARLKKTVNGRKTRRNEEDGKTEEMLGRRGRGFPRNNMVWAHVTEI